MDKPHQKILKTHLTRPIRLVIMCTLITSFFVVSPLLIAYASGYRYNFSTHKIVQTGVLNIDIEPKDAEIFLNNEKIENKIPFNISLYPDTYLLTIKKAGYKTWEKNITINSKQTTYINYFNLFKDSLPTFTNISGIDQIIGTPDANNILLLSESQNNKTKISSFTIKENIQNILLDNVNILEYSFSPYYDFVYFIISENNEEKLLLYDLNNLTNGTALNINIKDTTKIQWYKNKYLPLIIEENGNLEMLSLTGNKKNITKISTTTPWYVDQNDTVWQYQNNILSSSDKEYNLQYHLSQIIDINKTRILAKTNNEFVTYNIDTKNLNLINGDRTLFNNFNNSWIIFSKSDITEITESGTINLQYRGEEKIKNLQLMDEGKMYLIATDNELKILDVDKYLQFPVLSKTENNIYFNQKNLQLFYIKGENNELYNLQF